VSRTKRLPLTGGAGFIGSQVGEALIAAGHEVAVMNNLSAGKYLPG
jgi:UDP-glucose 4-epimerase